MKSLKPTLFIILAIVCGVGIGVYRIAQVGTSQAFFTNGCWVGSKNLPLGEDKLVTAQVTIFALFALPSREAVYLFARRDEQQQLLQSENDYTISGNIHSLNARYWSITAYGKDLYLIPNEGNRYSFNNSNLIADSLGNFTITLSNTPKPGNWLPTPRNARFNLVLRLYKGQPLFIEQLEKADLPAIKKLQL